MARTKRPPHPDLVRYNQQVRDRVRVPALGISAPEGAKNVRGPLLDLRLVDRMDAVVIDVDSMWVEDPASRVQRFFREAAEMRAQRAGASGGAQGHQPSFQGAGADSQSAEAATDGEDGAKMKDTTHAVGDGGDERLAAAQALLLLHAGGVKEEVDKSGYTVKEQSERVTDGTDDGTQAPLTESETFEAMNFIRKVRGPIHEAESAQHTSDGSISHAARIPKSETFVAKDIARGIHGFVQEAENTQRPSGGGGGISYPAQIPRSVPAPATSDGPAGTPQAPSISSLSDLSDLEDDVEDGKNSQASGSLDGAIAVSHANTHPTTHPTRAQIATRQQAAIAANARERSRRLKRRHTRTYLHRGASYACEDVEDDDDEEDESEDGYDGDEDEEMVTTKSGRQVKKPKYY